MEWSAGGLSCERLPCHYTSSTTFYDTWQVIATALKTTSRVSQPSFGSPSLGAFEEREYHLWIVCNDKTLLIQKTEKFNQHQLVLPAFFFISVFFVILTKQYKNLKNASVSLGFLLRLLSQMLRLLFQMFSQVSATPELVYQSPGSWEVMTVLLKWEVLSISSPQGRIYIKKVGSSKKAAQRRRKAEGTPSL